MAILDKPYFLCMRMMDVFLAAGDLSVVEEEEACALRAVVKKAQQLFLSFLLSFDTGFHWDSHSRPGAASTIPKGPKRSSATTMIVIMQQSEQPQS